MHSQRYGASTSRSAFLRDAEPPSSLVPARVFSRSLMLMSLLDLYDTRRLSAVSPGMQGPRIGRRLSTGRRFDGRRPRSSRFNNGTATFDGEPATREFR